MIPNLTPELQSQIEKNTEALINLGAKEWMRKRRKKTTMSEAEQKEQVRKIEDKMTEDK